MERNIATRLVSLEILHFVQDDREPRMKDESRVTDESG